MENKEVRHRLWVREFAEYDPKDPSLIESVEHYLKIIDEKRRTELSPRKKPYHLWGMRIMGISYIGLIATTTWTLLTGNTGLPKNEITTNTQQVSYAGIASFLTPRGQAGINAMYLRYQLMNQNK